MTRHIFGATGRNFLPCSISKKVLKEFYPIIPLVVLRWIHLDYTYMTNGMMILSMTNVEGAFRLFTNGFYDLVIGVKSYRIVIGQRLRAQYKVYYGLVSNMLAVIAQFVLGDITFCGDILNYVLEVDTCCCLSVDAKLIC